MKLLYICDWLPPDFGAVGQYSQLFARQRAKGGEEVVLVGLSSTADSVEQQTVGAGRLTTIRIHTATYDRSNFRQRARWTLETNLRLLWRSREHLSDADEILFTGSPPFLVHFLVPLNALLRKRLTYRITDFHPECLMAELERVPWPLTLFHRLTVALRNQVHRFEILGEDQRRRLAEIGVENDRIVLKRDPSPVDFPADTKPLATPETLAGKTVLLYSGNFGVAHDDATFIEGYRRHHQEGSGGVMLWLNATGAKADLVADRLTRAELPFHRGYPVPLEDLPRLLVTPDAHLITLRDEFVGYVLPSKVHACLDSGRRLLYVGSRDSDVHTLAAAHLGEDQYWQVGVEDASGVYRALEELSEATGER